MKVVDRVHRSLLALNESPSEKEGKSQPRSLSFARQMTLNESPSEKEGKYGPGRSNVAGPFFPQ